MSAERTRTYSWHDPLESFQALLELSGLEALRRTISGELPHPPIAETLGLRLVEAEDGRAVWEGEPGEEHYNPIAVVHAGFATTLLDSAMGCAFVTTAEPGTRWTTLELKANFTRPLTTETGRVRCTGTLVHRGRRVATTEARLEDLGGRLLAHATSTILVL